MLQDYLHLQSQPHRDFGVWFSFGSFCVLLPTTVTPHVTPHVTPSRATRGMLPMLWWCSSPLQVDSLLGKRDSGSQGNSKPDKRVTNEFLAFIDGIQTQQGGGCGSGEMGDSRIVVIAATNTPWDLDEAALSRWVDGWVIVTCPTGPSAGQGRLPSPNWKFA